MEIGPGLILGVPMLIAKLHRKYLLPSVRVIDRDRLPSKSGCYYVFRGSALLYVGKATNFRWRWANHQKLPKLRNGDRIHYWTMPKLLMHDREAVDICQFAPPLNYKIESRDWVGALAWFAMDSIWIAIAGAALLLVINFHQ